MPDACLCFTCPLRCRVHVSSVVKYIEGHRLVKIPAQQDAPSTAGTPGPGIGTVSVAGRGARVGGLCSPLVAMNDVSNVSLASRWLSTFFSAGSYLGGPVASRSASFTEDRNQQRVS